VNMCGVALLHVEALMCGRSCVDACRQVQHGMCTECIWCDIL
jgi:hypothetical protein